MRYFGSKSRVAPAIAAYLSSVRRPGQPYYELFLGSASVLSLMENPRFGSDAQADIIALLQGIRDGTFDPPESVSEQMYRVARGFSQPSALRGFIMFGLSYLGKYSGGFARDLAGNNYARESRQSLLKQAPLLAGARLSVASYESVQPPDGALVYCDPPYAGTTAYAGAPRFDSARFWQRMRALSARCAVYISEYQAPPDFEAVWQQSLTNGASTKGMGRVQRIEKLWHYRGSGSRVRTQKPLPARELSVEVTP